MKWLDVMMGEVRAKQDDRQARETRRQAVEEATRACLDEWVLPALQSLEERLRAAGWSPEVAERPADEATGHCLRLAASDDGGAFVEFAAEAFHRLIVVWIKSLADERPRRFAVLRVDDVDTSLVGECLEAFEAGLSARS